MPEETKKEDLLDNELGLEGRLGELSEISTDVRVINHSSLSFKFDVSPGPVAFL